MENQRHLSPTHDTRTQSSSKSSSSSNTSNNTKSTNTEPVIRSRWTPKPEQILILESIFNSGMVNPPKEETIRIRKLLEKFGAVGDANVFYWFQNRRSRSRRRQRQLQLQVGSLPVAPPPSAAPDGVESGGSSVGAPTACVGAPSGGFGCFEGVFGNFDGQMGEGVNISTPQVENNSCPSSSIFGSSSDATNLDFIPGIITVFINGVATQLPEGQLDVKAMFGEEVILVHSSGVPVPSNEFGISFQSLQHGESYFLVPRLT